jgi:beta-xylosidase
MSLVEEPSSASWLPDLGDGTYRNPIIHADYSDPDVVRVGDDFYLTSSSMHCTPGLPILHSRDLVNWTIIGHAVENLPHQFYDDVRQGHGVWAPSIRHHDERFWIVFPMPDHGIYVITAPTPRGPWTEPHRLLEGRGLIDPCILWDDDGQAYLVHAYAKSRAGIRNKLHVRPISPDIRRVLGEGKIVASIDEQLPALEGPKWLKRNGWYYISAPSGGVAMGWQVVFRSRNVYGPYEQRIVLAQRGTRVNGPHQGALVDTPAGEWWFLHFQDMDLYGRVVHLQPVRWADDWPLVGVDHDADGVGRPVLVHRKPNVREEWPATAPQTSDDFSSTRLGPQWQWNANHRAGWHSLAARPGHLRLYPQFTLENRLADAPHLLMQKFPAREFVVDVELTMLSEQPYLHAGVVVLGGNWAALDLRRDGDGLHLRLLTAAEIRGEERMRIDGPILLRLVVSDGGGCRFGVVGEDEMFHQLGPEFFVRTGVWVGAKFGLYCTSADQLAMSGHVDVSAVWVSVVDRGAVEDVSTGTVAVVR